MGIGYESSVYISYFWTARTVSIGDSHNFMGQNEGFVKSRVSPAARMRATVAAARVGDKEKSVAVEPFGTVTPLAWVPNIPVSAVPGWEQNVTLRLTRSDNVPPYHQGVGAVALHLDARGFGVARPQRFQNAAMLALRVRGSLGAKAEEGL
jgi:hypothetical protein